VYLIDTNVISEARKKAKANPGVIEFFNHVASTGDAVYLSVVTVGELRRGIELIRLRGDAKQATLLEDWLTIVLDQYLDNVLALDADAAQIWGRLRVPNSEHALDKQIAAIALVHDLTLVTRNTADFEGTGVKVMNPFVSTTPGR
jgi:predicted nucleic acid-binding protein